MPRALPISWLVFVAALAAASISLAACSPRPAPAALAASDTVATPATGLVLSESEGERRMRRPRPGGQRDTGVPIIIKVDGTNGGSSQLFMGYEDIPVGEAIQPHYHPHADEIVFVHRGRGVAMLGGRRRGGHDLHPARNTCDAPQHRHRADHHRLRVRRPGDVELFPRRDRSRGGARAAHDGRGRRGAPRASPSAHRHSPLTETQQTSRPMLRFAPLAMATSLPVLSFTLGLCRVIAVVTD